MQKLYSILKRIPTTGFEAWILCRLSSVATILVFAMLVAAYLMMPVVPMMQDDFLIKQEISVTFYDRDNKVIGRRGIKLDDSRKLEDYPQYLIGAILNTEDRRFFSHYGIDPIGTARAIVVNSNGQKVQGGSSITQQVAKNLFLNGERTLMRKIHEAFLAVWLENNLSKEEILKLYLDRSYMGGGVYGMTEAAHYYFNKPIEDINIVEAATLAGMLKAPQKYNPLTHPEASLGRTQVVINSMIERGLVDPVEVDDIKQWPTETMKPRQIATPDYFLDWAYDEVRRDYMAGRFGKNKVLHVYTAFDMRTQAHAEGVIERTLQKQEDAFDFDQVAMVIMDVDGTVRSMIGGVSYEDSSFNRVTKALRQPGSSFKPIVYTAAMKEGLLDANTIVTDRPVCIGTWCPKNYSGSYSGSMPAWMAMAKSINSVPVQLNIQMGRGNSLKDARRRIIDTAHDLGIQTAMHDSQSLPIGSVEVTPLDMATAYSTFANGGYRARPRAYREVKTSIGETIYRFDTSKDRVLTERIVQNMNFMLNKVVEQGTATAVRMPNQTIAGKTGTSNNYRDAWFVGYTGTQVAAVWAGNDDGSGMNSMTGGSIPARIWREVMEESLKGETAKAPPYLNLPVVAVAKKDQPKPPKVTAAKEYPPEAEEKPKEFVNPITAIFRAIFD